ncbi:unnamed protein product, partial [Symbiodinium sp. CCMP2592]
MSLCMSKNCAGWHSGLFRFHAWTILTRLQIPGFFKTGREASELISNVEGAVYAYKLTEDSVVLLRPKAGKSLPASVQQLSSKGLACDCERSALQQSSGTDEVRRMAPN